MSIRVAVCLLFVIGFAIYAYRNWFASLCAAIVLMAFLEHPDMPRSVLGIPGLNLWNLLVANVVFAWMAQRAREGLFWDFSPALKLALVLYVSVVIISFVRAFINPTSYLQVTRMDITVMALINPLKFLIPCVLLYDGCRTRERIMIATAAIMLLYFLLAVQVIRYMGIHPSFSGKELSARAAKILQRSVGYNRVDLSMMLAGASWAMLAFSRFVEKRKYRWLFWAGAGTILFAQSLTGGRTGYITWGAIGLLLCSLRWRKLLPAIPVAVLAVVAFVPGVADRMFSGFAEKTGAIAVQEDTSEITSGRNLVWPYVIGKIKESPVFGYGRFAMPRTGLSSFAAEEFGDEFGHPHNAYLEILLDNGLLGTLCVAPLFFLVLQRSLGTFRDRSDVLFEVVGGMALSLVLALVFASFGAQTFYPREGVVGMWAAIGILLRVSTERLRGTFSQAADSPGSEAEEAHAFSPA